LFWFLHQLTIIQFPAGRARSSAQPDGVAGDRWPSHCSASQAWNRCASVNHSFAARRIEATLAVWVWSTTGSPGRAPSNQSSAGAQASAA